MTEMAAYGLPTRARHWSYGKVYQSQRLYGTMGLSTIYEIVLNSDPCLAFLLETNAEVANLLDAAHVFGPGAFSNTTMCSTWNTWTGAGRFLTAVLRPKRWPILPSSGTIRCAC